MGSRPDNQSPDNSFASSNSHFPLIVPIDEAVMGHVSRTYWDWRAAFDSDLQASPLQHPDIVLAELRTKRVHRRLNPVVVCGDSADDHGAFGVLIPKTIRSSQVGGVGPEWTLQGLRLAGNRILGAKTSLEQQRAILKSATQHAAEVHADFLLIEDLDESTLLHEAVHDHSDHNCLLFITHDFQTRHYIDFPATEAEYLNTFSSHARKLFRKGLKKCGNSRLERITEVSQIPDFLDVANHVSKGSWQSRQLGIRIRNDEAELSQLSALAMQGLLRSYVFWIDNQPAAFAVGNQNAGCFRYEETGFDTELRHYSPGRTMLQQIIADLLCHDPARCFDFGFGDAEYKQQFANRQSRSGTIWLVPPTMRARMSLSHLNVCRMLRSAVYTRIKQSSLGTKARQWFRLHGATRTVVSNPNTETEVEPALT